MKKLLCGVFTATLLASLSTSPMLAADNEELARFKKRVDQINDAAKDPKTMQLAIKHISVETGVPAEQVRKHHERHPNMGAAGLLLANVMAAETKKPPATFLKERQSGDEWLAIAREHKVAVDKLLIRLDNVWKALAPAVDRKPS